MRNIQSATVEKTLGGQNIDYFLSGYVTEHPVYCRRLAGKADIIVVTYCLQSIDRTKGTKDQYIQNVYGV